MRQIWIIALLFLTTFASVVPTVRAEERIYRLGVPEGYNSLTYHKLFDGLHKKGFQIGTNLQIVSIDLNNFETELDREKIRREIRDKCDLFFSTGDHLPIILTAEIQTPLLIISTASPHHTIPPSMQDNATAIFRDSTVSIFKRSIQMLPTGPQQKLGIIYFQGSKIHTWVTKYQKIAKEELGVDLVMKEYADKEDIERVMRQFKKEGMRGIVLFPRATRKGELSELIKWQDKLTLPIIGQIRQDIEQGLLGGPAINYDMLLPSLTDYAAKILKGRTPGQLPVKYYSSEYIINLATVSRLGLIIPQGVVNQAKIVGLANEVKPRKKESKVLKPGNYVIGVPKPTPHTLDSLVAELKERGYQTGTNLELVSFDVRGADDPQKMQQIARRITRETDLFFATGNVLPALIRSPPLGVPICFIATKETAAIIPENQKDNFTGVIRASFGSIVERLKQMMSGKKRMGMISHTGSNILRLIDRYRKIASKSGTSIELELFTTTAEIGSAMEKLRGKSDFIYLFSPSLTEEHLAEIVTWQNRLRLPVLSQFENFIKKGLLGGTVIDVDTVTPKLAEYIDKLLQGRNPARLPVYYYQERFVINLKTLNFLQLEIPEAITTQAKIIR